MTGLSPLDEIHLFLLEQEKKKLPTSTRFLDKKKRKSKITFRSITSIFNNTKGLLDFDARDKSNKSEKKAQMRNRCMLLKVEQHFSLAENSISKHDVLAENALKEH